MIDTYNILDNNYKHSKLDLDKEITSKVWEFFINILPELGYESREGQEDMALDICDAIKDNEHIMVEAGVGIGKSYAYLVPLIYYNNITGYPVVVSTSTILLQEQLVNDIKNISKLLHIYPDVVLAKGMSHFVCKKRTFDYIGRNSKIIKSYPWLEEWIENNNGDRTNLPIELNNSIWRNINVNNCSFDKCNYSYECNYTSIRNKMLNTKGIILCNHDLLSIDAQKKDKYQRPILSRYIKLIVIDEAHNLEDKVRNSLKQEWLLKKCIEIVNSAFIFIGKTYNDEGNRDKIIDLLKEIYDDLWSQVGLTP